MTDSMVEPGPTEPAAHQATTRPHQTSVRGHIQGGVVQGGVVQAGTIHGDVYLRTPPVAWPTPRQLHRPALNLVDRSEQQKAMTALLPHTDAPGPVVLILTGAPGMGTTALTEHWLASHADHFADGQFYLHLGDTATGRPAVGDALGQLLRAAGIPPHLVPTGQTERATLWRTYTATRTVAILVEHPQPGRDVLDLLPASPSCLTVVTTYQPHLELLAHGAHLIKVGPLDEDTASAIIDQRLRPHTIAADPAADPATVRAVVQQCHGNPRALLLTAAALLAHPHEPADRVLTAPRHEPPRTESPAMTAERPVAASLHASYAALPADIAPSYRAVGLIPGETLSVECVAAATDIDPASAHRHLTALAQAALLDDIGEGTYRLPDAVRRHLRTPHTGDTDPAVCNAIVARAVRWYLLCARTAAATVIPARRVLPYTAPFPYPALPPGLTALDSALSFLDRQRRNIGAAVAAAVDIGLDTEAVCLADALQPVVILHGDLHHALQVDERALVAADRAGDHTGALGLRKRLARGNVKIGDLDTATRYARQYDLAVTQAGDQRGRASALKTWGAIHTAQGDPDSATTSFSQAVEILRRLQRPRALALAQIVLGETLLLHDHPATAAAHLAAAYTLLDTLDPHPDTYNAARAAVRLARAWLRDNQPDFAKQLLDNAADTITQTGSVTELATIHAVYAEHAGATGDATAAAEHRRIADGLRTGTVLP